MYVYMYVYIYIYICIKYYHVYTIYIYIVNIHIYYSPWTGCGGAGAQKTREASSYTRSPLQDSRLEDFRQGLEVSIYMYIYYTYICIYTIHVSMCIYYSIVGTRSPLEDSRLFGPRPLDVAFRM